MTTPRRLRAILGLALGSLLAISLAGCPAATTSGQRSAVPAAGGEPDYVFPALAEVSAEALPDDIELVAAALTGRLKGVPAAEVERRLGVENSAIVEPGKKFPLDGFRLVEVQVLDAAAGQDKPAYREVGLVLNFVDGYSRRASAKTLTAYEALAGNRIRLIRVAWRQEVLPLPRMASFVVSYDKAAGLTPHRGDFRKLFDATAAIAIPRKEVPARLAAGGEFMILSFTLDYLGPGAELRLELTESETGPAVNPPEGLQSTVFPGHYAVIAFAGKFPPSEGKPLWLRIKHTPGGEARRSARRPIVVELYPLTGVPGS